jgi:integrase
VPLKTEDRLIVKLKDWPGPDQDAWANATRPGDVLEPGGAGEKWSPASTTWKVNSYGHWVGWLRRNGLLRPGAAALDMICRERVLRYIADMRQVNASSTVADRIQKLSLTARAMAPDRDWEWLRKIYRKLARIAVPARDKRSKLVSAAALYRYGIELMAEGEELSKSDRLHDAVRYRDGLMIALLIARPILRRKNLAALKIAEGVYKRGEHYFLSVVASEMKQRAAVDVSVPPDLTPYLDRYIAHHRPYLFPRNRNSRQPVTRDPRACSHLWVSTWGKGISVETIYQRFVQLTRAKFGKSVNPHLCRDIAATSFAIEDPAHVQSSMNVLGHADFRTTERTYNLARSFEATQRHQKNILQMRKPVTEIPPGRSL